MPEIILAQAREFLDKISQEDKVAVIHHDDADGFVSGILLYDWCKEKGAEVQQFTFSVGDSQQEIINKLRDFNKVLFSDLASGLVSDILNYVKDKKVLYIDHHQKDVEIPESILEYRTKSSVSTSKSVYSIIRGKKWLEIVSELADAGYSYPENKEKIDKFSKERGINPEEVKEKFYFRIDLFLVYFHKDFDKSFDILDKIQDYDELDILDRYADEVKKELNYFIKNYENKKEKLGFVNYYYFEPKFPIKSRVTTDISFKYLNETFVFAISQENNKVNISARNQSGDFNCVKILKKATEGLEGANAGGHFKAAGALISKEDLGKFKENLVKLSIVVLKNPE